MSTNNAFDLYKLYEQYFNATPYFITPKNLEFNKKKVEADQYSILTENPRPKGSIDYSSKHQPFNDIGAYGQAIWFPITLKSADTTKTTVEKFEIKIEACTISVNLSKTIIRTAVSERKGTVKECFGIDDYKFNVKGMLIGKDRLFPEDQINLLKKIFESNEPVELHGGYPELFLDDSCRVAVSTLDFPEVQGKSVTIRPFTMTLETDYIQDLIIP